MSESTFPRLAYHACLKASLRHCCPLKHRADWPLFHFRAWRKKCSIMNDLSKDYDPIQFPYLAKWVEFGRRRGRCYPVSSRGFRELFDQPGSNASKFHCNQVWFCPWCSTRRPVAAVCRLFRKLAAPRPDLPEIRGMAVAHAQSPLGGRQGHGKPKPGLNRPDQGPIVQKPGQAQKRGLPIFELRRLDLEDTFLSRST